MLDGSIQEFHSSLPQNCWNCFHPPGSHFPTFLGNLVRSKINELAFDNWLLSKQRAAVPSFEFSQHVERLHRVLFRIQGVQVEPKFLSCEIKVGQGSGYGMPWCSFKLLKGAFAKSSAFFSFGQHCSCALLKSPNPPVRGHSASKWM